MTWGYKYQNGDLVLNEVVKDEDLQRQGMQIWANQERGEYYTNFGYDRNFFISNNEKMEELIEVKFSQDLGLTSQQNTKYSFVKTLETLKINLGINNK